MRRFIPFLFVLFSCVFVFAKTDITLNKDAITELKMNADYDIPWMGSVAPDLDLSETEFIEAFVSTYLNEHHSFVEVKRQEDNIGMTHVRFHQYAHGLRVEHGTLILHLRGERVESFNGEVYPVQDLSNALLTYEEALAKYSYEHPLDVSLIQTPGEEHRSPVLMISEEGSLPAPSYMIVIANESGSREDHVYISASDASILSLEPQVIHTDSVGTAKTYFRGTQTIVADYLGTNSFRMKDNARDLNTYDGNLGNYLKDSDNKWETAGKEIAGDVHWGMGEMHNFMDDKFGWNSYANNGDSMVSILNFGGSGNAFWNLSGNYATFLVNKTASVEPCAAMDVVGHEFGHGICDENADMVYTGETCMLHESFADISGAALEYYVDSTTANWLLGDEVWNGGIRNIQNPATFRHPKTYKGTNWGRGCHGNGGVQNYWFYLVAEGDTGTNDFSHSFSIPGLGRDTALQIIFRAVFYYARPRTNFPDMASYTLKATKDLYGTCGKELQLVWDAWKAVGIEDTTVQLINLDHGIVANKLRCTSLPVDQTFKSKGDPTRTVMWDFGNNDTSSSFDVSRTFTTYGPKTVMLSTTVCNKAFRDTFTIQINAQPTAEFTPNQNVFCFNNGDTLHCDNTTKNPDASQNLLYKWTVEPYLYEFTTEDLALPINGLQYSFTVQLDAFYKTGCSASTRDDFSLLPAPIAQMSAKNICSGEIVKPTNSTDTTRPLDLKWEVRHLQTGALLATSNKFAPEFDLKTTGEVRIILEATDPETKCNSIAMDTIEIFKNPTPTFTREGACLNDTVTFTHTTQHDVNLTWFQWNFGIYRPFNKEVVHFIPREVGVLKFSLETRDDNGCRGIVYDSIEIETIEASFEVEDFCQNTTGKVINNSSGTITGFSWDLGNGESSTNTEPELNYDQSGTYDIMLTATSGNCSHTISKEVVVYDVPQPDFNMSGVCAGEDSHFENLTPGADNSSSRWSFGDGDTSVESDPTHFYEVDETTSFNVRLEMSNSDGCINTTSKVITINDLPNCGFTWEYAYPSREVHFMPDSSEYSTYSWDFGDGNSSDDVQPKHQYEKDKNYVVTLEIQDKFGCACLGRKSVRGLNLGVGSISVESWDVYPNPNAGVAIISGPQATGKVSYSLTDIHGRIVKEGQTRPGDMIDLQTVADGTYMFRIHSESEHVVRRLVIHRQ